VHAHVAGIYLRTGEKQSVQGRDRNDNCEPPSRSKGWTRLEALDRIYSSVLPSRVRDRCGLQLSHLDIQRASISVVVHSSRCYGRANLVGKFRTNAPSYRLAMESRRMCPCEKPPHMERTQSQLSEHRGIRPATISQLKDLPSTNGLIPRPARWNGPAGVANSFGARNTGESIGLEP
jgi:hypothetical protein